MTDFLGTPKDDEHFGQETLMNGLAGNDGLFGTGALDTIFRGKRGNDEIVGGQGHDDIYGGRGDDFILGSIGNDRLTGGRGADTFYFATATGDEQWGADRVTDFQSGRDKVMVRLGESYPKAQVTYDTASGILSVDADGANTFWAPVALAKFKPGTDIGDVIFA